MQISVSELKNLFAAEIQALRETIVTHIAVEIESSRRQFDCLNYLAGPHDADVQHEASVHQLQAQKIAASHASFGVLSRLAEACARSNKMDGREPLLSQIIASWTRFSTRSNRTAASIGLVTDVASLAAGSASECAGSASRPARNIWTA